MYFVKFEDEEPAIYISLLKGNLDKPDPFLLRRTASYQVLLLLVLGRVLLYYPVIRGINYTLFLAPS